MNIMNTVPVLVDDSASPNHDYIASNQLVLYADQNAADEAISNNFPIGVMPKTKLVGVVPSNTLIQMFYYLAQTDQLDKFKDWVNTEAFKKNPIPANVGIIDSVVIENLADDYDYSLVESVECEGEDDCEDDCSDCPNECPCDRA